MASSKKLVLKCTGISLQADGRQQVSMVKPAATETTTTDGGGKVVNQPDAALTLAVDAADSANYSVGKEYTLTIAG